MLKTSCDLHILPLLNNTTVEKLVNIVNKNGASAIFCLNCSYERVLYKK